MGKGKDQQQTGGLHATLNEMKRMIDEEREAAELMTRQLANHRGQGTSFMANRPSFAETELAEAKKQIAEQKATTEKWIQQITAERDAGRARLREAEASVLQLQKEIAEARAQHLQEREAAEKMVAQLCAEKQQVHEEMATLHTGSRDAGAGDGASFAGAMKKMEEELEALRARMAEREQEFSARERQLAEKFAELAAERDRHASSAATAVAAAERTAENLRAAEIRHHEQARESQQQIDAVIAERDSAQAQFAEVEARTQAIEKEFVTAHELFRQQRETAKEVIRTLESERTAAQERMLEMEAEKQEMAGQLEQARASLLKQSRAADDARELRNAMLDAVIDMQTKGQKVLELLQAWSSRTAPGAVAEVDLPAEETVHA